MNPEEQPLVSIVTPVYNEEEFLAECIESVLAQTYGNWDYTIVDNRSTDRSLQIARDYAARDSRIRVHANQEFLQQMPNHNLAMRQISPGSKYCKVVLGDDFIFPECLEKMVAVAEKYPSAGIVSAYQLHGEVVRSTGLPYWTTLLKGREACRMFLLETAKLFGTSSSILYRADLVRQRDPFFVETDMSADFEACFALLQTTNLAFVHQVLTYSRIRPGSIGEVTSDMGANFVSLLGFLMTYGRRCLTPEEFQKTLHRQLGEYYDFLGRRFWVERNREFWAYHRKKLNSSGVGFSYSRLGASAFSAMARSLLHPKEMAEQVNRLTIKRRMRSRQTRGVVLDAAPGQNSEVECSR